MRAQEIVLKTNLDSLAAGAGVGGGGQCGSGSGLSGRWQRGVFVVRSHWWFAFSAYWRQ